MSEPTEAPTHLIGSPVRRVEDLALVTGAGHYVDDLQPAGMLHMAVIRSPHPQARVVSVNTEAARAIPGVQAVLTGGDIGEELTIPAPPAVPGMRRPPHPVLARGIVHAVGVPVAAVAATDRAIAQDAIAAIEVEYDALPSVATVDQALAPGAPLVHEEWDSNVCYTIKRAGGDVARAFEEADHVARLHIRSPRLAAVAMEPRGVLAVPDPLGQGLTVWLSTQSPHRVRADLATALGFPENRIRLIAPDVGGGFGSKGPLYREDVLACYLALKLGRPVKWIATRGEDLVTTIQGRDMSMAAELAVKKDGTMLGLRVRVLANLGAYLQSS
ncbi:MAG: xanthine dehydrogenase family protein molybdopterin-binding subunit, partial [Chloroflexota bacterium]